MKTKQTLIAIDRLTSAIKYLSWAIQEEEEKRKKEWYDEADTMIQYAKEWLAK